MCNLSKDVWERGVEKGILTSLKNLMENMNWPIEQAMSALGIAEKDHPRYMDALSKQ